MNMHHSKMQKESGFQVSFSMVASIIYNKIKEQHFVAKRMNQEKKI